VCGPDEYALIYLELLNFLDEFADDGHLHVVKGVGDVDFVIVGVDETALTGRQMM
jgi:hypothetical protein